MRRFYLHTAAVASLVFVIVQAVVMHAWAAKPLSTTDFASSVVCEADFLYWPTTTAEVSEIVASASRQISDGKKVTLRVSRPEFHSSNAMPCPDDPTGQGGVSIQLYLTRLSQVYSVDATASRIHVGAGMLLKDFLKTLSDNNMSLPVLSAPIYAVMTLGAVVANEAHGSNMRGPGIFADLVVNATWVDGTGKVNSGGDLTIIAGAMGLTGILTELVIQAKPATKTRIIQQVHNDAQLSAIVDQMVTQHASTSVLWRPSHRRVYTTIFEEVPADTPSDNARHALFETTPEDLSNAVIVVETDQSDVRNKYKDEYARKALDGEEPSWFAVPGRKLPCNESAVGWSNDVSTGDCLHPENCIWKATKFTLREIAIAIPDLPEFFEDVRNIHAATVGDGALPYGLGFWMRFVKGSPYLMGYAYGRDSVYIEMATAQSIDLKSLPMKHQAFYEEVEQVLFCKYAGRPHWGKSTNRMFTPPCHVRDTLPKFDDFMARRASLDPQGIFLPAQFARLANRSGSTYYPGCALKQDCYCKEDIHCQSGDMAMLLCTPGAVFKQFNVCAPAPESKPMMPAMFAPPLVVALSLVAVWMLQLVRVYRPAYLPRSMRPKSPTGSDESRVEAPTSHDYEAGFAKHASTAGSQVVICKGSIHLQWDNIRCTYTGIGGATKTVLQGICGSAAPGQLVAIMGPSGAGKSTLLDILAMRRVQGQVHGLVKVNGACRQAKSFVGQAKYVTQDFALVPTLTVGETLHYAALLALPSTTPASECIALQEGALAATGLSGKQPQLVGGELQGGLRLRGLSGGEQRRLAIACQIVPAPPLLLVDEPTSGLDSSSALAVMGHLKGMAAAGHTIITAIHQPRQEIWNMFDKVLLVADSRMVFFGPPAGVAPWFESVGFTHNALVHGSVSDWALDLICTTQTTSQSADTGVQCSMLKPQLQAAADSFHKTYVSEDDGVADTDVVDAVSTQASQDLTATVPAGRQRTWSSFLHSYVVLVCREWIAMTRNPTDAAGRLLTIAVVGILTGLAFCNLDASGESYQLRLSLMFYQLVTLISLPFVSMSIFTSDKRFFVTEAAQDLYSPAAYYLAKVSVATPLFLINATCYALISYGMAGLNTSAAAIGQNVVVSILVHLIFCQVMHMAATLTSTQDTAFMMAVSLHSLNLLFSNFLIPADRMSLEVPVSWLKYISAVFYTFSGMVRAEFSDRTFYCPFPDGIGALGPCIAQGDKIVEWYGPIPVRTAIAALAAHLVLLHLGTYLGHVMLAKRQRAGRKQI